MRRSLPAHAFHYFLRHDRRRRSLHSSQDVGRSSVFAGLLCVLVSLLLIALRDQIGTANVALLFLLPIVASAIVGGLIPSVLAAVVCALVLDFFCIPPYHTLSLSQGQDVLTLVLYLASSVFVAEVAGYARAHAEENAWRTLTSDQLYDLSTVFLVGTLDTVLEALVERLAKTFGLRSCAVLLPDAQGVLQDRAHWGPALGTTSPDDKRQLDAVAAWAYTQGDTVGFSLDRPMPSTSIRRGALVRGPRSALRRLFKETVLFFPLRTSPVRGQQIAGVLALTRSSGTAFGAEETRLLGTFATQAALAIDRARLVEESAQAAILRESDLAKSVLLSNVSHDLRTPLTTIRGAAESLLAADVHLDEQTSRELLASIRDESDRLTTLVANLLSLSRLEAGALHIEQHLYNLAEIAGGVVARLRPRLADHVVNLALAPDVPPVLVDYALFEQVLVNLLDNAAKYAPEHTVITVRVRREHAHVVLSVLDEGPGIPRTARNRVFDRFYRLPQTGARHAPGTGLGLAICHAVVAAHGGRIWVDDGASSGTTISIALAIPPQPAALDLETAGVSR